MHSSTAMARVLVDELVRGGVTDAVFCPGSRNAPLAFALHDAAAAGRLRLHVRIDERTAGFLALGLALRSGRAVPVCTTSGTAVANLHPAVLEAAYSGVRLVALTADRPPQLVGTGASQTVVQDGVLGLPTTTVSAAGGNAHWRSVVARVLATRGPAHLNAPFDEPLTPSEPGFAPGRDGGAPWTALAPLARTAGPLPLDPSAPTLVVAGAGAPPLAGVAAPVVAEPSSGEWAQGLRAGPWLLDDPALRPAQVVVAGRPTLHRGVARLLADPAVAVYALDGDGPWTDVPGTVRAVGSLPPLTPPDGWLERWRAADRAASEALDAALPDAPGGLRLARSLVAALPPSSALVLGSSNPVRDVALAAVPRPDLTVLSNRGVAGIDGTVSTAVGVALAHDGPAFALMGDLTFLHDTTGLLIGPGEPRPDLTVVVLNDGGGGIFGLLEQGAQEHSAAFERMFGTPQEVSLEQLCGAFGIAHAVSGVDLAPLPPPPGLRVVEVRADRSGLRSGHAALRERVSRGR
ncbi:2-succinyl-5-enolpyruvyl-6-hydroxy-3-cyclohexene-1-carboxylic-acid synthase [Pseudonocardia broussonetiae]|uniref:2-succinyl-5-enolpyruvyl-6-hydroxy-3-cyclohexene-1-carboxylate synthase n=1 Tax=Pseudonocardia broussonetiae TaxID=2736640 RepID=A0A6M6JIS7_9PSEU|nr:2-succinyl-5-enolpyruvyl-6-hydroxy-3-cyclohexene-1-carboxylic-acid synthase [Pseudonocardia broussonetiae]QJY46349.1 2-succinyl-5-enolpyruvyl-6-hydroxy-3-cyclohexene-1-carboxylic-acid synthase [Pseudonocardia broussonetiae]